MAALKDRLIRLPAARLEALAADWGVAGAGQTDVASVLAALEDPLAVKRRLARLTDSQLAILGVLDGADGPLSARLLGIHLNCPPERLTPDLRRLGDLLLISRSRRFEGSTRDNEPPEPLDVPLEIWAGLRPFVHQVVSHRTLPTATGVPHATDAAQSSQLRTELQRRGGRAPFDDLARRIDDDVLRAEYLAGRAEGWLDEAFQGGIWWLLLAPVAGNAAATATRDEGTALLWDLLILADAIEYDGLALGNATWALPPDRHDRLRASLRGSPQAADARLTWLIRLTIGLGLAEPAGRTLEPTGTLPEWAALSFASQAKRILEFWRDDLAWTEPVAAGRWAAALDRPRLRSALLHRLHDQDLTQSVSLTDITRETAADSGLTVPGRWSEVSQGQAQALLASMLDLTLAWLGIVAIEHTRRTVFVRVTEFGRRVLTSEETAGDSDPSLIVQGDLDVLCIASPPAVLARVLRATELVDPGAISLHRFTRESLLNALDRGEKVTGLLEFFGQHARAPVPDSVAQAVHDWTSSYWSVAVRPATLVEFDPPLGPNTLDPNSALAAQIARQFSPSVAELRPDIDFAAFRRAAEAAGFRLRRRPG